MNYLYPGLKKNDKLHMTMLIVDRTKKLPNNNDTIRGYCRALNQ